MIHQVNWIQASGGHEGEHTVYKACHAASSGMIHEDPSDLRVMGCVDQIANALAKVLTMPI